MAHSSAGEGLPFQLISFRAARIDAAGQQPGKKPDDPQRDRQGGGGGQGKPGGGQPGGGGQPNR